MTLKSIAENISKLSDESQALDINSRANLNRTNADVGDAFNSISKSDLFIITKKLQKQGILGADETIEQWLSRIMPQITNGSNLTLGELLTGLKQLSKL